MSNPLAAAPRSSTIQPTSLRREYRQHPLGIDEREPRLSWILDAKDDKARGLRQSDGAKIVAGRNDVGIILGNGRYWAPRGIEPIAMRSFGYPKARLQLQVEYEDGTGMAVVTDGGRSLSTNGPIRANNEYDGEDFNARLDRPQWSRARFDDCQWGSKRLVRPFMCPLRTSLE